MDYTLLPVGLTLIYVLLTVLYFLRMIRHMPIETRNEYIKGLGTHSLLLFLGCIFLEFYFTGIYWFFVNTEIKFLELVSWPDSSMLIGELVSYILIFGVLNFMFTPTLTIVVLENAVKDGVKVDSASYILLNWGMLVSKTAERRRSKCADKIFMGIIIFLVFFSLEVAEFLINALHI